MERDQGVFRGLAFQPTIIFDDGFLPFYYFFSCRTSKFRRSLTKKLQLPRTKSPNPVGPLSHILNTPLNEILSCFFTLVATAAAVTQLMGRCGGYWIRWTTTAVSRCSTAESHGSTRLCQDMAEVISCR